MDVNETLRQLREYVTATNHGEYTIGDEPTNELIELFEALDDWLTKGGELPDAWNEYTLEQESVKVRGLHLPLKLDEHNREAN